MSSRRPTTGRLSAVVDLVGPVVVAIDGATVARAFHRRRVVCAREQADVVDLGDAPREELDRPRGEVSVVVRSQCREVGAVQLVHVDFVRVRAHQNAG